MPWVAYMQDRKMCKKRIAKIEKMATQGENKE